MESLLDFDPAAPLAEDQAYRAGLDLNNPPQDFDAELPGGITRRQVAESVFTKYMAHTKEKGFRPFPTKSGASAEADALKKVFMGGIDGLPKNMPADQWQMLEQAAKQESDPQEYMARALNATYLKHRIGQEIPPGQHSTVRDAYARQELGLQGELSDKIVLDAIKTRYQEDANTQKALSDNLRAVTERMLSTIGKKDLSTLETKVRMQDGIAIHDKVNPSAYQRPTIAEREEFLQTIPERHRDNVREQWNHQTRELSRLFRRYEPLATELTKTVDKLKLTNDPDMALRDAVDNMTASLPEDKKDRGIVLAMLSNTLKNNPELNQTFTKRLLGNAARGVGNAWNGIEQMFQAEVRQLGIRANGFEDSQAEFISRRRELLSVIQGSGMDLVSVQDGIAATSAVNASGSAWMIPASFHPLGVAAMQQSMAGDSYQNARLQYEGGDETAQVNTALISGSLQAGIERFTNTAGVKIMLGKLPTFTGLLNRAGVQSATGRAALGFGAGFGATTGMEYAEEMTQGAADMGLQALAADLSGLNPDVQWGQYFKDWATVAGPEQQATLSAVMAFGMIAGAGASYNHFKYGAALAQNKTFLKAHGFTDGEVREITNTTNLDEAADRTREAFLEAQKRGKNMTPEEKDRLAIERKEAIEVLKARDEAARAAGTPVITKEKNDFTEETEFIFSDPITGTQSRHETEEDAFLAWRDWARTQEEEQLDTLRDAAHSGSLELLTGEGQAAENVQVGTTTKVQTLTKEQEDAAAELKSSTKDLDRATNELQKRQASERIQKAQGMLGAIKARMEVMIYDQGFTPTQAAQAFQSLTIRAKNYSREVMGRIVGYTVQLYGGHTVQDIFEDFAEVNMKQAINENLADPEQILEDLRTYERASGARLIDPAYRYDPANTLPIAEGFSKLARGVVMSEVNSGLLPPTVSKWIKTQVALEAASIELARDLGTAAEFREALAQGYVPPKLHQQLMDSVGLDPKAQMRRLEQKHEEQLAAEAMEGFPEVSEEAKGRLPHPETLRANQHPLAGEVRRLWESLKKATKRRTKEGKTVDRTNEANAYFLPIGEMEDLDNVLRTLNEKGFDFESITDMLDALDASISYGKPFYGTGSPGGSSYAIGQGVALPPTTQESRIISDAALVADSTADSGTSPISNALAFQSAPGEPSDERDISFSLGRSREIYEKAKTKVLYAKKELMEVEETAREARDEWIKGHGLTFELPVDYHSELTFIEYKTGVAWVGVHTKGRMQNFKANRFVINGKEVWRSANSAFDFAPFPESSELIAARESLAQAEADLYLAEEEFDPETDARLADAEKIHQRELDKRAAMFAAALDEEDIKKKNASKSFISKVWNTYAKFDEIFQYGKTTSKNIADICAAVSAPGKVVTFVDNGSTIRIEGKNGYLTILDADTARPAINSPNADSNGKKQGGGSQLYVVALDWIHNNGKRIKDDSGITGINYIRRTSNFFASAIRWGTTRHLKPHALQGVGKWTKNDVLNTALLATKEMDNAFKAIPESRSWTFDFSNGIFKDADGNQLKANDFDKVAIDHDPKRSGIGLSTLQRAIVTASAIEEFQRGSSEAFMDSLESGLPDSLQSVSYAIGTPGITRLEAAIAKKLTEGPDERAAFYERLRNRLASTVLMLRETKRNTATTITEAEAERNRIQDALAEAQAVLGALPPEARGRVSFNPAEVMDATTERGQVSVLLRLIDRADEQLEAVLRKEYHEKFEILLDLAKPDLRQNKSIRGRLTPDVQRQIGKVLEAVTLSPEALQAELIGAEARIASLAVAEVEDSKEARQAHVRAQVEATIHQTILETFGNFSRLSASEMAHAYMQLESIYVNGRTTRKILDENRRNELKEATREVLASLPPVDQAKHATKTADQGIADEAYSWLLGMSSFHQVMERLFPKSVTARDMQERVRKADRAFTRAKIDAKNRFDAFIFGTWNLTGVSRRRKANQILADLSTRRSTWNIEIREGMGFTTEKLTEEQAIAILNGEMKIGWEDDRMAMTSLNQALIDFRMMRLKAQNEEKAFRKNVIQFQRLTSRGTPGPLVASDLEMVYFLQLYAQEQYGPALDKHGFTEEVMERIAKKLNPKAHDLGEFLRGEYDAEWDRLNPVYQRLYGLDMPKIRNYAPGMFEHMDAKSGSAPALESFGDSSPVNSMSAGFTKSRSHHMARPRLANAMAGYWSHLESTEYFIAYAEVSRDARQIFRNPEVRRRLEGNYGLKAAKLFGDWLDALEVDGNFRATTMQSMAAMTQKALATQSAVGLAFNVGVLLKQIPAAMGFILEMPAKQAIGGIMAAIRRPSTLRHVWNSEAVQQRVLAGISPEDRKLLDAGKVSPSILIELLELGRLPIAYADAAFTTLSGSVAYAYHYDEAIKANLSPSAAEAAALAAASRVIERTAQPATAQDKSMMENTAKGFTKFLMMFKSDPRQKLAIVGNAVQDVLEGKKGAKARLGKKALFGWLLYGLANEVLADVWASASRDGDDPDRWSWRDYLAAMIAGSASSVPYVGQLYELTVRATVGTRAYVNSSNPADNVLKFSKWVKVWEELQNFEDMDWNANDWLTSLQQASAATALVAGFFDPRAAIVPAGVRLVRDVQGLAVNAYDAVTPETEEEKAMDIIDDIRATSKATRDTKLEEKKAKAKELLDMDPENRAAAIQKLDRDTARYVIPKLKMAQMSLSEQALARLPVADRQTAIEKITSTMDDGEKAAFMDRLKSLGLTF